MAASWRYSLKNILKKGNKQQQKKEYLRQVLFLVILAPYC